MFFRNLRIKNFRIIFMGMFCHVLVGMENKDYVIHCSIVSIQGRKSTQEDYVNCRNEESLPLIVEIFDGNGLIGYENIERLANLISKNSIGLYDVQDPTSLIKNIFENANKTIAADKNEYGYCPWDTAGATALLLFNIQEKLYLAWTGDSDALYKTNNQMEMTKNHALNAEDMIKRIIPMSCYRIFGNFSVNLENQYPLFKKKYGLLTAEPSIVSMNVCNTEWILMATDGLWAHTTKEDVFNFVNKLLKIRSSQSSDDVKDTYSDILKKVMILSILNDVQHNLIKEWFQFFFKEYARIIYPALRLSKVTKESYIKTLQKKVQNFNQFTQSTQFVLDGFPFIINPAQQLQIKKYFSDKPTVMPLASAIEDQHFPLQDDVKLEIKNKQIIKEGLKGNIISIIIYLYSHLDDETLSECLKHVFELNLNEITVSEDNPNAEFFYWELAFLIDMKNAFKTTLETITKIKNNQLLKWHPDNLEKIINNIQQFASDNTAMVFLNIEKKPEEPEIKQLPKINKFTAQSSSCDDNDDNDEELAENAEPKSSDGLAPSFTTKLSYLFSCFLYYISYLKFW